MWCSGGVPGKWGTWWGICAFWRWLETGLGSDGICEQIEQAVREIFQEEVESWNSWVVRVRWYFGNQKGSPLLLLEIPYRKQEKTKDCRQELIREHTEGEPKAPGLAVAYQKLPLFPFYRLRTGQVQLRQLSSYAGCSVTCHQKVSLVSCGKVTDRHFSFIESKYNLADLKSPIQRKIAVFSH